ncbi:MAG: hypothetical protein HYZ54_08440 [Ignavibacteriae bacterium]|nr:hypothetical protein [Ignavibacteriota bacterium]
MRKIKFFTHSLLLFTTPSLLLHPQDIPPPVSYQVQKIEGEQPLRLYSYDELVNFVEYAESVDLENKLTDEEMEKVSHFMAFLAKEGQLPSYSEETLSLDEDIEELLEGDNNQFDYTFSMGTPGEYIVITMALNDYGEVILCKGWIKKKAEQVKKFVKKHKKAIIIGAAVVVAATGITVAVAAAATSTAAATAAAATAGAATKKVVDETNDLLEESKKKIKNLMRLLRLLADEVRNIGEKISPVNGNPEERNSRENLSESYEKLMTSGHQKIDNLFSTDLAGAFSKEAKAHRPLEVGIPFGPGIAGVLSAEAQAARMAVKVETQAGRIAASQVTKIKGWKVGDDIRNLTSKGNLPKWDTVRRRFWKTEVVKHPEKYAPEQLERMKKGLAPQRLNTQTGKMESMELHHDPAQRDGGLFDFVPLWPDEHAGVDSLRRLQK